MDRSLSLTARLFLGMTAVVLLTMLAAVEAAVVAAAVVELWGPVVRQMETAHTLTPLYVVVLELCSIGINSAHANLVNAGTHVVKYALETHVDRVIHMVVLPVVETFLGVMAMVLA